MFWDQFLKKTKTFRYREFVYKNDADNVEAKVFTLYYIIYEPCYIITLFITEMYRKIAPRLIIDT